MAKYKIAYIKKLTRNVFSLDDLEFEILGIIGLGYSNKNQIYSHSSGSRRKIEYRIKNNLIPHKFIFVKERKPYRNNKKAFGDSKSYVTTYGLTSKGFLASLAVTSLKENYLIKEYCTWLIPKLEDDVLEYIQRQLMLYFLTLQYQGIKLDYMVAPFAHIHDTDLENFPKGVSKKDLKNFEILRNDFSKSGLKIHRQTPHSKEGNEWATITELWYYVIQVIIDGRSKSEISWNEMPKWYLEKN